MMPSVGDAAFDNPIYAAAERYTRLGISVIPIQPGTKEPPAGFRWGEFAHRIADASERYTWFVDNGWQIAVVSGPVSGWLVPLDFDGEGGFDAFAEKYPAVRSLPRLRTGSGKTHVWLRTATPTKKYVTHAPDGSNLEVRAGTHYTLVPPSVHPNGESYTWEQPPWRGIPTVTLTELGLPIIDPRETEEAGEPIDEGEPLSERDRQHIFDLVMPHYVPYSRHDLCLALSGWLASHGIPEADARWLVRMLAEEAGDTARIKEYMRGVRDTYRRTREGVAVAGWSRLVSMHDPLISPGTAMQLDLLVRGRNPVFSFDENGTAEHQEHRERFRLIPVQEMKTRKPPPQIVQGVLSHGSMAALIGDSGTYKSFLALDLALHIGAGLDWYGRPVEQGFVVYISAEGSAGMGNRIKAWEIAHGQPAAGVWFITEAVQFPDPTEVSLFLERLEELDAQPSLIVIDTLARATLGLEENSSKDMGLFIAGADRIKAATGAVPLVVHHMNRQGSYRGSTAIRAALDTMLEMRRDENDKSLVTLSCDKQKDLDLFEPIRLTPEIVEIEPGDDVFSGQTSVVLTEARQTPVVLAGAIKTAYDALVRLGHGGVVTIRDWEQGCGGMNHSTFYRARQGLMDAGLIVQTQNGYRPTQNGELF